MDSFKIYTQGDVSSLVNQRDGETKLGEKVLVATSLDDIIHSTAKFVLLGIPEDIGVRANLGIAGTKKAWDATLKSLLNMQSNPFLVGDEILVLGHFEIDEPTDTSLIGLRQKVNQIDALVYPIIQKIVSAGKIPIVIGGGHNNAFPIIAGASMSNGNKKMNVVNIDAHADLRNPAEGRHSGNGFSTAIASGYLNQYQIFGLQQNYINQNLPDELATKPNVIAFYFEDLLQSQKSIVQDFTEFTGNLHEPCGLEIDLDSIENILSSAQTSSGFALNDIRKIILSNTKNYSYLHICEGATELADGRKDIKTGKTIAYLVSDFVKALLLRIYPQP